MRLFSTVVVYVVLAVGLIRGSCAVHVQCFAQGGNANGFSIGVAGTPTLEECNVRAIAISAIFPFIEPGGEEPEHFECRLETKWLEYKILVSSAWHGPDIYQQMVQSGAVVNDCDVHSAYQGMGKGVKNDLNFANGADCDCFSRHMDAELDKKSTTTTTTTTAKSLFQCTKYGIYGRKCMADEINAAFGLVGDVALHCDQHPGAGTGGVPRSGYFMFADTCPDAIINAAMGIDGQGEPGSGSTGGDGEWGYEKDLKLQIACAENEAPFMLAGNSMDCGAKMLGSTQTIVKLLTAYLGMPPFIDTRYSSGGGCKGEDDICAFGVGDCAGATTKVECEALCAIDAACVSYEWKVDSGCQMSSTCFNGAQGEPDVSFDAKRKTLRKHRYQKVYGKECNLELVNGGLGSGHRKNFATDGECREYCDAISRCDAYTFYRKKSFDQSRCYIHTGGSAEYPITRLGDMDSSEGYVIKDSFCAFKCAACGKNSFEDSACKMQSFTKPNTFDNTLCAGCLKGYVMPSEFHYEQASSCVNPASITTKTATATTTTTKIATKRTTKTTTKRTPATSTTTTVRLETTTASTSTRTAATAAPTTSQQTAEPTQATSNANAGNNPIDVSTIAATAPMPTAAAGGARQQGDNSGGPTVAPDVTPASPASPSKSSDGTVVGVVVACVLLFLILIAMVWYTQKQKAAAAPNNAHPKQVELTPNPIYGGGGGGGSGAGATRLPNVQLHPNPLYGGGGLAVASAAKNAEGYVVDDFNAGVPGTNKAANNVYDAGVPGTTAAHVQVQNNDDGPVYAVPVEEAFC